ncbi:MAG: hypothetical protein PHU85_08355 [Phycisphaerae bacterium]|nr:hypothetical protein [Phycisphaerae bacterium]
MRHPFYLALMLVAAMAGHAAIADTVTMHDGRKFTGTIVVQGDPKVVMIDTQFGRLQFRAGDVLKVDYEAAAKDPPTGSPLSTSTPQRPATQPEPEVGTLAAGDRELFIRAVAESEKALTASEGLAVWTRFAADHRTGSLAGPAKTRLAQWQERVDKNLVRFGPTWIPRADADRRAAKADELFAQAAKADNADEAARLLDAAAASNPYRADIPFAKAKRIIKAGRTPQAVAAFDAVLTLTPDQPAAMNNLGVLMARDKNFARAFLHLARAASLLDSDVVLDNIDAALVLAREADAPKADIAAAERQVRQIVDAWHKAGKHVGQTRWGNSWVAQAQIDQMNDAIARAETQITINAQKKVGLERDLIIAEKNSDDARAEFNKRMNQEGETAAVRDLAERLARARNVVKKLAEDIRKLDKENTDLLAKQSIPPHATKLVLLDADGKTELSSFPVGKEATDLNLPGAEKPKANE